MRKTALSTFSILVLTVALCGSGVRSDGLGILETTLEDSFTQELIERGLKSVIPVLEDNGVTSLRIFSSLEKEDFADMSLKLGHRREMVRWWKSYTNSCPLLFLFFCSFSISNFEESTTLKRVFSFFGDNFFERTEFVTVLQYQK